MFRRTYQAAYDQDDYDGRAFQRDNYLDDVEMRYKMIYGEPDPSYKPRGPGLLKRRARKYTQAPGADRRAE